MASLHGAVSAAESKRGPRLVHRNLHLDVSSRGHLLLEKDPRIPEGTARLVGCALEARSQLLWPHHRADASTPAAGRCLDDERIADAFGVLVCEFDARRGLATPGRDRDAKALGQSLCSDFVAEPPHGITRGPEEDHAPRHDSVCELGILGHETPAGPNRIRPTAARGCHKTLAVQMGGNRRGCRSEGKRGVGMADEGGAPVQLGVEGQAAQIAALLRAQRLHRPDQAKRGLATIGDCDAAQLARTDGPSCVRSAHPATFVPSPRVWSRSGAKDPSNAAIL